MKKPFSILVAAVCLSVAGIGFCDEHDHDHGSMNGHEGEEAHLARHGGALVGLEYDGDEVAHLEMTSDPVSGEARFYLTDQSASERAPIPQETIEVQIVPKTGDSFTLTFEADPMESEGESLGDSSVFAVKDTRLAGMDSFGVRIPSIFIMGFEVNDISFDFPEGNH